MQYEVNFGRLGRAPHAPAVGTKFRLALLGDFSGRANAGAAETGPALAQRKPTKVDVDNLDAVVARMKLSLKLPLDKDGGVVTVPLGSMDDFHPDQLVENVELFETLLTLRRNLGSKAGFERAATEVRSWSGEEPLPPPPRTARGSMVATDRKLSDFGRLVGRAASVDTEEPEVEDLVRRLVGPFIVPARDTRQDLLVAALDEALSAAMRRVLHHPDFQTAESLWRSVEFLVRRIETGAKMEIVLYDVSAEEFAADLAAGDALDRSGLYSLLVEQPAADAHQGPLSALIGLYTFDVVPPHADLLGRAACIAAAARAPFLTGIGPDALATPLHEQHSMIQEAFSALQALPEAAYLGLAAPRFLLRMPYGRKTDPIDAFAFEEFTRRGGLSGMLWGHAAVVPALLLAETWQQQGAKLRLGSVMGVGDIPYYVLTDADGDQIALPCTERMYSERQAMQLAPYRVMPLLSIRGRPEVRLGSFASQAGTPLAGFWAPFEAPPVASAGAAASISAPETADLDSGAAAVEADLDALLASLSSDTPPASAAMAAAAPPDAAASESAKTDVGDELDALLASLNAPAEPVAADETESDLDALLASLK